MPVENEIDVKNLPKEILDDFQDLEIKKVLLVGYFYYIYLDYTKVDEILKQKFKMNKNFFRYQIDTFELSEDRLIIIYSSPKD